MRRVCFLWTLAFLFLCACLAEERHDNLLG